ncbi:hypothetical protein PAXINDRAFT_81942, partial [Paxillus involutus ATCC 200175]
PSTPSHHEATPWHPFESRAHFKLADFIFCRDGMSGGSINELMDILAALNQRTPPFTNHKELYNLIDAISPEEMWECISIQHAEAEGLAGGDSNMPTWKQETYDMWLQDSKALIQEQLSSTELKDYVDYAPRQVFGNRHQQVWSDFMAGNWAWEQCNELSKDPENHGAMFVPIILESDKTTVSVATGNNEYPFPGLRQFPQGRGFKQWTGDDSKALMKVGTGNFLYRKIIGLSSCNCRLCA